MSRFEWGHYQEQLDYLEQRGIDRFAIEKLGIRVVTKEELVRLKFSEYHLQNAQRGLLLPINDIHGEVIDHVARVFYPKSFVESPGPKLLHHADGNKPPSVHFSPLADWDKLEHGQRVFVTESVIKANVVARLGYHAIGVNGCWGFSKKGTLHWSLKEIDWRGAGIQPVLLMDSNVNEDNPKLRGVMSKFQAMIDAELGMDSSIVLLPPDPNGDDWGIDDYYQHHGADATRSLIDSDPTPIVTELGAALVQLNHEVCVIRDVGKFADIRRNILMGRSQFEDVNYATRQAVTLEDKPAPVAKVWTKWDKRNEVDTMKYKPGEERLVQNEDESYFNLWRGWGCEPLAGDASLFRSWVEAAFSNDVERQYFLDWWSYQIQYPGVKLNTSVMLVGPSGVGKGWMAGIAERIFGSDNTWKCNLSDLESRFNAGVGASQLLVIEEADVSGGVKVYNTLKDLITNEHLRYERKGVDAVKLENVTNVFLNSNHIDVLQLDEFDRRFAVLEIDRDFSSRHANDMDYWEKRWDWIRAEGAAVIHGYLLSREISPEFKPQGEAPWTQAKRDMIEVTHDPLDTWVKDYVLGGDEIVVGQSVVQAENGCGLMSAKELAWCYLEGQVPLSDVTRKQSMMMVTGLNNARAQVANAGKKIKYQGLPTKYYWVGGRGLEENYQQQLDDRLFWRQLVASQQGKVASDEGVATGDTKY